jgi:ketosteroid isomerase-like protein
MSGEAGVAAQGFADVLARGDADALGHWVTDDASWSIRGARVFWLRHVRRYGGAPLARASFSALMRRCDGLPAREFVEVGDRACIGFRTPEPYLRACRYVVVAVRGGMVVSIREYRQRDDALRALGLRTTRFGPVR